MMNPSDTPLYTALSALAASAPARFHMPGHKGGGGTPFDTWYRLDFTEITPTGNLYEPGGAIGEAEALWAKAWGAEACQFLTNGSTQGVHTALTLCCAPGDAVLLDRAAHRSAWNAMALLDLRPVSLPRPWDEMEGVARAISPQTVDKMLAERPGIKTVCITSPNYYGILCDIPAISAVVHRRGGKLIVDGAHGAHLPFLGQNPFAGADLVVTSAHKTLPAPGQSALLFANGFDPAALRKAAAVNGTSSPSYPMMAALDWARAWMEGPGRAAYERVIARAGALDLGPFARVRTDDPLRLVIRTAGAGWTGFAAAQALETAGIYCEMADRDHLVLILTGFDSEEAFRRLETALSALPRRPATARPLPPPPLAEPVLTPRQAFFAPRTVLPLDRAEDRVAAEAIAPYPPGVPVVAPGERIGKKHLAYLREIEYNGLSVAAAAEETPPPGPENDETLD